DERNIAYVTLLTAGGHLRSLARLGQLQALDDLREDRDRVEADSPQDRNYYDRDHSVFDRFLRGDQTVFDCGNAVVLERATQTHHKLSSLIGIGGHLAVPPLPHHRAYGSRTTAVRLG